MKYKLFPLIVSAGALAACTQPAAQVSDNGGLFYGKSGATPAGFMANATLPGVNAPAPLSSTRWAMPVKSATASTAKIGSVNVSELAPPPSSPAQPGVIRQPTIQPAPVSHLQTSPPPLASNRSSGFIKPVNGRVISQFGKANNGQVNDGINIAAPVGEPVYASAGGKVAYVGNELKSYGNMVIVKHANGRNSTYAHLGRSVVARDTDVQQGQIIGYVGQSGSVSSPQLHFAIREGSVAVNPATLIGNAYAGGY